MSTATDIKHIVRDPDVYGGKPCIEGHRISVHDVAAARSLHGYTPEPIVEAFPTLTLADVYAALLYYEEHKAEIDREIAEDDAFIRARARADMSPHAQKMRRAIAERKRQLGPLGCG
jgi:uncharacterized protein (DUF433 family)